MPESKLAGKSGGGRKEDLISLQKRQGGGVRIPEVPWPPAGTEKEGKYFKAHSR